jgi:4-amino-4-deoxy-L-arabinose transferase-like glycosyltransferase
MSLRQLLSQRLPARVLVVAGVLLLFRLWLAAVMPMTGDEAYFYYWGLIPDWGFYDHPPMVGWWLAALLGIADSEWVLRLPVLLLPLPLAVAAAWLVAGTTSSAPPVVEAAEVEAQGARGEARRSGKGEAEDGQNALALAAAAAENAAERGAWAAMLVLLAPLSVWNVFITTDTPLIFFSMLSVVAYVAAIRSQSLPLHALAGLFLGLAFLSKYFAVLLGIAIVVHVLALRRDGQRWSGLALLVAVALLGPALNIWWNAEHCWANILFNLYNRHEDAGLSWKTPLIYLATLVYVLTPFAFFYLARYRREALAAVRGDAGLAAVLCLAAVPFALFAALSSVKLIGLHWLLSFVPLVFVVAAAALPLPALRRLVGWTAALAVAHVALIITLALLPLSTWSQTRQYDGLVLTFKTQELLAELQPYEKDYVFASDGYSNAVTLGYNARRYFLVFGEGSSHARHDDILTDFRELDGKNILVLRKSAPTEQSRREEYQPYFHEVEYRSVSVAGVSYYLILGRGFDYGAYRSGVLRKIKEKFYRIPAFLPIGACYFGDRYFPGEPCR